MPILNLYISHSRPYLVGNGEFKNKTVFGVVPGDLIRTIGKLTANGKISSSCRRDVYDNPVLYVGTVDFDESEWMVFKVDKKDHRKDIGVNHLYVMYIIMKDGRLLIPDYVQLTTLVFHPVFEKVGESKEDLVFSEVQLITI